MARYRKKPVEVEAWQVGSEEPCPKWVMENGASHHVHPHQWFVRDERGYIFIESMESFKQTYDVVE